VSHLLVKQEPAVSHLLVILHDTCAIGVARMAEAPAAMRAGARGGGVLRRKGPF